MDDASDDEILQTLALAFQSYARRFGEDELVAILEDMTETIKAKREDCVLVQ